VRTRLLVAAADSAAASVRPSTRGQQAARLASALAANSGGKLDAASGNEFVALEILETYEINNYAHFVLLVNDALPGQVGQIQFFPELAAGILGPLGIQVNNAASQPQGHSL
jgi:hypothetical protein